MELRGKGGGTHLAKNVAQVIFSPIQTVVWHAHRQLEAHYNCLNDFGRKLIISLIYVTSSNGGKKEKVTEVASASGKNKTKTKTIWVFPLNLKANSTDKPVSKCKKENKWQRKKNNRPNCLCGCQPECTCTGGGRGGLPMTEGGYRHPLPNWPKYRIQTKPGETFPVVSVW